MAGENQIGTAQPISAAAQDLSHCAAAHAADCDAFSSFFQRIQPIRYAENRAVMQAV